MSRRPANLQQLAGPRQLANFHISILEGAQGEHEADFERQVAKYKEDKSRKSVRRLIKKSREYTSISKALVKLLKEEKAELQKQLTDVLSGKYGPEE